MLCSLCLITDVFYHKQQIFLCWWTSLKQMPVTQGEGLFFVLWYICLLLNCMLSDSASFSPLKRCQWLLFCSVMLYVSQGFSFVNYMAKGHTLNNTIKYLSFIPNCATHSCLQVKLSAHSRESKTIKAVKKQTPDWCIGLQENNLAIAKSITEISNPVCYLKVATWLPWHRAKWPFGRVCWTFLKHGTKMWVFLK